MILWLKLYQIVEKITKKGGFLWFTKPVTRSQLIKDVF